jgi:ATP-dependent Clp protease ATP-binding subunit ClpC
MEFHGGAWRRTEMWQRFTGRARRVVFYAQEEAGRLGENYVSSEHLLLGLVREHDTVAGRILDRMGFPLQKIRSELEKQVTRGNGRLGQDMQLTPRAKRCIDIAYDEARQLNNSYITSFASFQTAYRATFSGSMWSTSLK